MKIPIHTSTSRIINDLPDQNDLSGSCYIGELLIQNKDKALEEFA
jgi:hypothetical protein